MSLLNNADDVKIGNTQVEKIYLGPTEVWTNTVYYTLTLVLDKVQWSSLYSDPTLTGAGTYAEGTQVSLDCSDHLVRWEDKSQSDQSHISDFYDLNPTVTITRDTVIHARVTGASIHLQYQPSANNTNLNSNVNIVSTRGNFSLNPYNKPHFWKGSRITFTADIPSGFSLNTFGYQTTDLVPTTSNVGSTNGFPATIESGTLNNTGDLHTILYATFGIFSSTTVTVDINIYNYNGQGNTSGTTSTAQFGDTVTLNANPPSGTTFNSWSVVGGATIANANSASTTATITATSGTVTFSTTLTAQAPVGSQGVNALGGKDNHGKLYSTGWDNVTASNDRSGAYALLSDGTEKRTGKMKWDPRAEIVTYSGGSVNSNYTYALTPQSYNSFLYPIYQQQADAELVDKELKNQFGLIGATSGTAVQVPHPGGGGVNYYRPSSMPLKSNYSPAVTSGANYWTNGGMSTGVHAGGIMYVNAGFYPGHSHVYYKSTGTSKTLQSKGSNLFGLLGRNTGGIPMPVLNGFGQSMPSLWDDDDYADVKDASGNSIDGVISLMTTPACGHIGTQRNLELNGSIVFLTEDGTLYALGNTYGWFGSASTPTNSSPNTTRYKNHARVIDTNVNDFYFNYKTIVYRKNLTQDSSSKWQGDLYYRMSDSQTSVNSLSNVHQYSGAGDTVYAIQGSTLKAKGNNSHGQMAGAITQGQSTSSYVQLATDAVQVSACGGDIGPGDGGIDCYYLTTGGYVRHAGWNQHGIRGNNTWRMGFPTPATDAYNSWANVQISASNTAPFTGGTGNKVMSIVLAQGRQAYLFTDNQQVYFMGQRGGAGMGNTGQYWFPENITSNLGWIF